MASSDRFDLNLPSWPAEGLPPPPPVSATPDQVFAHFAPFVEAFRKSPGYEAYRIAKRIPEPFVLD